MDKVTMLKRLLKPGLLIITSIILISFNHILAGIILLIFHCIDNFYTLNSFWTKEDDINYFSKTLDKGIEDNVLQFIYPLSLIREDGEIIYNYSNVKKILDIYKSLCNGNREVLQDLVEEFNKETKNQKKMDKYENLLKDVTDDILGKIEEEDTLSIFSLGDLNGMFSNSSQENEFEIISYLVIK